MLLHKVFGETSENLTSFVFGGIQNIVKVRSVMEKAAIKFRGKFPFH